MAGRADFRRPIGAERRANLDGNLGEFFNPDLAPDEHEQANIEGWILGIR